MKKLEKLVKKQKTTIEELFTSLQVYLYMRGIEVFFFKMLSMHGTRANQERERERTRGKRQGRCKIKVSAAIIFRFL